MPKTFSTCGVPYSLYEDGKISVNGVFPAYTDPSTRERIATRVWERWGAACRRASQATGLPVIWIAAIIYIESAGDPRAHSPCNPQVCPGAYPGCTGDGFCAGGIMQFIPSTARSYGHTIGWYLDHPEQMILDGADILAKSAARRGGDILTAVKKYNGGSSCAGSGITGHGGQSDYVSKFVRTVNTLHQMGVSRSPSAVQVPASTGLLAGLAVGVGVYVLLTWYGRDRS